MKRRFESNVATDLPKTRMNEPGLPWKLTDDDLEKLNPHDEDSGKSDIFSPPLKTRAMFPILLVLTIFVVLSQAAIDAYLENDNIQTAAARQSAELAALETDVARLSDEKARLGEETSRLEKRIEDLGEQKELFTAALESLTRKSDEIIIEAPPAQPPAPVDSGIEQQGKH